MSLLASTAQPNESFIADANSGHGFAIFWPVLVYSALLGFGAAYLGRRC